MKVIVTQEKFFSHLRDVMNRGWIHLPDMGYRDPGDPGMLLAVALAFSKNKRDRLDAIKWEIKFHGDHFFLTLLHRTPEPKGNRRAVVKAYGWPDDKGRISFRHTILGSSNRGFQIISKTGRIRVRNTVKAPDILPPYWTHDTDTLINALVYKLRSLAVIRGKSRQNKLQYVSARLYWELQVAWCIQALASGLIVIDFDARTTETEALRDHGTKFRINIGNLKHLYLNNQNFLSERTAYTAIFNRG